MELPLISELTSAEEKAKVQVSPEDPSRYPEYYYWPFDRILQYTSAFPVPPSKEWESKFRQSNWDPRYRGYMDWAVPEQDDGIAGMMRIMQTQMISYSEERDDWYDDENIRIW